MKSVGNPRHTFKQPDFLGYESTDMLNPVLPHRHSIIRASGRRQLIGLVTVCFLFFGLAAAWANEDVSQGRAFAAPDALGIKPNRVLPTHSPPSVELALSDNSSKADLEHVRLFAEPLVVSRRAPSSEENRRLTAALRSHAGRAVADEFLDLERFVADNPDSPWTPSVLFNLGMDSYNTASYSKTIVALEKAWALLKDATDPKAKALADRAAGELALMYARFGRVNDLSALLTSLEGRGIVGAATEQIAAAKQALWIMQTRPEKAYRCGPLALERVLAYQNPTFVGNPLIEKARATTNGYSLAQLARLSVDLGLNYQKAHRDRGAALIMPAVIHWKFGHFAALLKEEDGRYLVQDVAFGRNTWVSKRVLEEEASGYFLVPSGGDLPAGWRPVTEAEAAAVWGRSWVYPNDPNATTPNDKKNNDNKCSSGMAVQSVYLMAVSLNIEDIPVWYRPPVGPAVSFHVTYNQRDVGQPAVFSYSNLGPKWTFNWLAFITDNPSNPSADVNYYTDGGGILPFTGFDALSQTYATQQKSQARLTRTSTTSYEMLFADGSKNIFTQPDSVVGTSRRVFLTRVVDPYGNAVQISYDASFRVVAVTDAIGQVTTFSYTNADTLKITKVTDPFGRFASFAYDASGRLTNITDCIQLNSQFGYDAGDFIQAMTTPYGTTTFAKGESTGYRWLEITYPTGEKERLEVHSYDDNTTYYWDRKAYAEGAGDYSKAHIYHWWIYGGTVSGILVGEKLALENQVSYGYDVPSSQPNTISRVLDDGTTQLRRFKYNAFGHITNAVDPVGRAMTYVYSGNLVDLLEVRQTTATNNELIAKYAYNTNHLPFMIWDAADQLTTNSYNARGQLLTTKNPKNETTTLNYDTNGYLLSIDGPLPGTNDTTSFAYDSIGRVRIVTSPDGYTLAYSYDNLDRLTNITYPDSTFEAFTYDKLDRVKTRDRMGRETLYTHDSLRRLTSTQDPLNRVTRFEYCGCGSMSALIDPIGRRTSWEYDIQGRVTAKQYVDGSRIQYTYESTTSRLKSVYDEKGQLKVYYYYPDDNRRDVFYPNAQIPTPMVMFTYDTNYDRLASMQDGIGLTTWSYYPPGVLGAFRTASVDGPWANDTVTYYYDALGRVMNRSINGVSQVYVYDPMGRTTNVVNVLGSFGYSYDGSTPRVQDVSYPGGQTVHYQYFDNLADHRLQRITNQKADSSTISRFTYSYNPVGNITNWIQETSTASESWAVSYDAADQLRSVVADRGSTNTITYAYDYDSAGNRLFENTNSVPRRFDYNVLNQLVSSSDGSSTNAAYEWDAEQRLTAVVVGNHRSEFAYDGLGRRLRIVEKEAGAVQSERRFIWCDFQICEQRDASDTPVARYFLEGEQKGNTATYYARDHLGSIRELSEAGGVLRTEYAYQPYGNPTTLRNELEADFGFTGAFRHQRTGLFLMPFRAYDPASARWLSRDPLFERSGVNLYSYVGQNPLNRTDPLGLWFGIDDAILTGGGAVIGVGGQALGDLISWHMSGWEDYVGSAIGGAVGGEAALYTGPVGASLAGGMAGNASKQLLKMASGKQCGFDFVNFGEESLISGVTGFIPGLNDMGGEISGINAGQGSYLQVYNQIITKAGNGSIGSITSQTAEKMFIGKFVNDIPGTVVENAGTSLLPGSDVRCKCKH